MAAHSFRRSHALLASIEPQQEFAVRAGQAAIKMVPHTQNLLALCAPVEGTIRTTGPTAFCVPLESSIGATEPAAFFVQVASTGRDQVAQAAAAASIVPLESTIRATGVPAHRAHVARVRLQGPKT